jgi:hypothetical protein
MDGTNFFNTVSRETVLEALSKLPELLPFMAPHLRDYYITYSHKHAEPLIIKPKQGLNQGGALSGPVCNAAAGPITATVLADNPGVTHTAIVDDNGLAGEPELVLKAAQSLRDKFKSLLGVKMAHLEVYAPRGLDPEVQRAYEEAGYAIKQHGLVFAGTPVGSNDFKIEWVKERAEGVLELLRAAGKMVQAGKGVCLQRVFRWLRLTALPSFNHVLRVVEPEYTEKYSKIIDEAMEALVLELCQGEAAFNSLAQTEEGKVEQALARQRIHLPVRKGGLGLASQQQACWGAYVGGIAATLGRVVGSEEQGGLGMAVPGAGDPLPAFFNSYEHAMEGVRTVCGEAVAKDLGVRDIWPAVRPGVQKRLSGVASERAASELDEQIRALDPTSDAGKVRMDNHLAQGARESGAWLSAVPSAPGCAMTDFTFQHAMRARLGLPMILPGGVAVDKCPECDKTMDPYGNHAHVCNKFMGHRANRAAKQKAVLVAVLREAEFPLWPGEPPVGVFMDKRPEAGAAADKKQRFDVGITPKEQNGRTQLIDLVCTATSKGKASYKKAGQAATAAEALKIRNYIRNYVMSPAGPPGDVRGFGMETGGPLGSYAKQLLETCAQEMPARGMPGQNPVGLRHRRILERFSVFIQEYNASVQRDLYIKCVRKMDQPAPPAVAGAAAEAAQAEEEEEEEGA